MASEILSVPEEKLHEVIRVIHAGLHHMITLPRRDRISEETRQMLSKWCQDEELYLRRLRKS